MSTELTQYKLAKILPHNHEIADWVDALNANLSMYQIDTEQRIASFLAQCSHESAEFTHLHENLNYGAAGLMATWPSRFPTRAIADAVERQPIKIANIVYANRMGNGDVESGDGWKYRGRGIIQITRHDNYKACSQFLFQDDRLLTQPDYLETKEGAVKSACWYWTANNLNSYADVGDIKTMTRRINGGYTGLAERTANYTNALTILQG
jgi:putative chitinase